MTVQVIKGGLLTTVQDMGRHGHQASGMPVAGAMDTFSLQAANLLVGNDPGAAALEITLVGPQLRFLSTAVIAVTGGDLSPAVDGNPLPMWENVLIEAGSLLTFGAPRSGCRAYLAVAGGWAVEPVMGSRSTYVKGQIGGYQGRALKAGDTLLHYRGKDFNQIGYRIMQAEWVPRYKTDVSVRAIVGPQADFFSSVMRERFFSADFCISPLSDRMGYRLEGPSIQSVMEKEMISDATALGAVQVPPDGQPILLMADRQTTGGYPKIATVITADIPLLAQAQAGHQVRFVPCTLGEARAALRQQAEVLRSRIIARRLSPPEVS
ncbi:allophanate hydrolase subunit 2 [Heliomicrobium modesticaldum Ice1]|uniref:Allophanate hydrolase subunit 2 n=2 Tax=Heliomicrobium modesticaldum TaxID=35701 RepID=B0TAN8_HELMI|nr:allophanate hydrolase subunit 2 [Heliomicrobium modesticaldum Ice1]